MGNNVATQVAETALKGLGGAGASLSDDASDSGKNVSEAEGGLEAELEEGGKGSSNSESEAGAEGGENAAEGSENQDDDPLKGEKVVQLQSGEWISKASFLKRLKKEAEHRKELEAKMAEASPYLEKKDHYARWDQHHKDFESAVEFSARLNRVVDLNPWTRTILEPLLQGKPVNWQQMVQILKPYMAPHWDGVQVDEGVGEAGKSDPRLESIQQRLDAFERKEQERVQKHQEEIETQRRSQTINQQVSTLFKGDKAKWKAYDNPHYIDILFDAMEAESIRTGKEADPAAVANRIFGGFEAEAKRKALVNKGAGRKAGLAAGERGGSSISATQTSEADAPKSRKEGVQSIVNKIRSQFGNDLAP